MPDDALLLDRATDDEAGNVVEEHQRDAERVAQPHEARRLVCRVHVERSAEHHGLIGKDPDRASAHARQHRHDVPRELRLDLEELTIVDDRGYDLLRVVEIPAEGGLDDRGAHVPTLEIELLELGIGKLRGLLRIKGAALGG